MQKERGNTMQEPFTINLPKITEKQLLARYDGMVQAILDVSDDEGISRETVKEWVGGYQPVDVSDE